MKVFSSGVQANGRHSDSRQSTQHDFTFGKTRNGENDWKDSNPVTVQSLQMQSDVKGSAQKDDGYMSKDVEKCNESAVTEAAMNGYLGMESIKSKDLADFVNCMVDSDGAEVYNDCCSAPLKTQESDVVSGRDSIEVDRSSKSSVDILNGSKHGNMVFCDSVEEKHDYDGSLNIEESNSDADIQANVEIFFDDENEHTSDDKDNKFLEKMHPRIISLFVPEDDDLTRQDIEELTLKIEDVCIDNQSDNFVQIETVDCKRNDNVHEKRSQRKKRHNLPKFDSQQEQILVLDLLQEKEIWIRKRFENCAENGRRRIYRRLLEVSLSTVCSDDWIKR